MKVEFLDKFSKDIDRIDNVKIRKKLAGIIEEIENSEKLSDLKKVRKITGFKNAYRIKLADYRIGFFFEKGIIEFARIMHRKEIYKFFP